jgi:hypothetical protein
VKLRSDLIKTVEAFKKAKTLAQSFKATAVTQKEEIEMLKAQLAEGGVGAKKKGGELSC